MFNKKLDIRIIIHIITTLLVLFNAAVPAAALAQPPLPESLKDPSSPPSPNFLSSEEPVYYSPGTDVPNPTQTSPEEDKPKSRKPERDNIDFSISLESGQIGNDNTAIVLVTIRNRSESAITDINYYDKLEPGLVYVPGSESEAKYSLIKKTVTFHMDELEAGETVSFTYNLEINNKKNN